MNMDNETLGRLHKSLDAILDEIMSIRYVIRQEIKYQQKLYIYDKDV